MTVVMPLVMAPIVGLIVAAVTVVMRALSEGQTACGAGQQRQQDPSR